MPQEYESWLDKVADALRSINMNMGDWQPVWPYDFKSEYDAGTAPDAVAMKANRFWWREQNRSLKRACEKIPGCWLPRGHQGDCQPAYNRGDYVKVEFPDKTTGIGEWMWMRVDHCDDSKQLVFGQLDNEPLNSYGASVELGSQLAVSYSQIRQHNKPGDFCKR